MTIRDKIEAGDYETKLPWPDKPKEPAVLGKKASALTAAERALLESVQTEYRQAMEDYRHASMAYRCDVGALLRQFDQDLCQEYGLDQQLPFVQTLLQLAWQRGHGSGLSNVVCVLEDMLPLWEEYQKALVQR